ncbi:uncharacterized protein LOC134848348 isoform X2 [Symsagittifera roscoffensis]
MLFVGFGGSYLCMYIETMSCFINTSQNTCSHVSAKLIHDFFVTWFQVFLWKSWWDMLDFYTHSTFAQVCELIVSCFILISCRSLTVTAQLTITKEEICKTPTVSDTISTGITNSANITSTLVLVHILSITVWTQVWNLTDKFLLPGDEHYYTSTSISLVFGLLLMGALFVFDQVKSCLLLCCKNSYPDEDGKEGGANRRMLFLVYYLMASFALLSSIQCWRGVWGFGDYFMELLQKEHMLNNKVLEIGVLCAIAIFLFLSVFSLGYSQNIASYTLDFDKGDFDLNSHFLLWKDPAKETSTGTLHRFMIESDPEESMREDTVHIPVNQSKGDSSYVKIRQSQNKSSTNQAKSLLARAFAPLGETEKSNNKGTGSVRIPLVEPAANEPLLNQRDDEEETSSLEQHKITD